MNTDDAYKILDLPNTTTLSNVKKKYHELARKVHPDKNKSHDAKEQFQRLNAAYQKIKSPNSPPIASSPPTRSRARSASPIRDRNSFFSSVPAASTHASPAPAPAAPAPAPAAPATAASAASDSYTEEKDLLSITIDNIRFTLIYKANLYQTGTISIQVRPITQLLDQIVKIKSVNLTTGEEEEFWVYMSFSELGIWRFLCYVDIGATKYDKGKDYVQSTCVNMYLQKHIHLCYDMLPLIPKTHPDLKINTRVQTGYKKILSQVIKVSGEYIRKYKHILYDSNREKYMVDPTTIPIKCGVTKSNPEFFVKKQIITTSDYLKSNFKIVGKEELFTYNFVLDKVLNTKNTVIKVILEYDDDANKRLILYYKRMIFTKLHDNSLYNTNIDYITEKGRNIHFSVILVTRALSSCLSCGLYSEYCHLGIYVCKPFDYAALLNGESSQQCTNEYAFVADRYRDIFPINILEAEEIEKLKEESMYDDDGMGKKKKRTKKHKKYKKHKKNGKSMKNKKRK